ncbi:hypothetical protein [Rheinheimera texasensis]|uniref:hypothetical protein n=1 Tax=Rheinheimera texasensis TaxID=306205 RepID=UPI0004E22111|nr:hypothetical protein [Rheinheimera texasensis]
MTEQQHNVDGQYSSKLIEPEMLVHWTDPNSALCVRDHWVYRYHYQTGTLSKVCRIPPQQPSFSGRLKDALARSSLLQWLRPTAGLGHVHQTRGGDIVIIYDRIYLYPAGQNSMMAHAQVSMLTPKAAAPLRGGIAEHGVSGKLYYGEYLNGHSRDIRVICFDPATQQQKVCWQFSRSEIKHVHAIHYDPFRNRLWLCSGDTDAESAIYYTDDEFNTLYCLGRGSQKWRAIALWFDDTGIEWGMDAGKDAPAEALNQLYRVELDANGAAAGEPVLLQQVGNPVYAALTVADGSVWLQTTFEPGRLQSTPEAAALWHRTADSSWQQLLSLDYQHQPRRGVSKYGYLLLPKGTAPAGKLLYSPVNCQQGHYGLYLLTY